MLDVTICNSYILFKNFIPTTGQSRITYKQFRLKLATELIGDYNSRHRYRIPTEIHEIVIAKSTTPIKRRRGQSIDDGNGHYPTKCNKLKCWYCWNVTGVRHESRVKCKACDIPLCVYNDDETSCFEKYHKEQH